MKRILTTLIVCVLAVVVYLQDGTTFTADEIIRFTREGVIVESCNKKNVNDCKRMWIPNTNVKRVVYDYKATSQN